MQVETHWQDVLESLQGIGVPCRLAMGIADILHEAGFTGPAEAQGAAVLPRKCPRPRSAFRANIDQEIENVMPQLWCRHDRRGAQPEHQRRQTAYQYGRLAVLNHIPEAQGTLVLTPSQRVG
jgi:hypothetical protein